MTHMPDVVTKVTQNSMSFTAEQKPRKQSSNQAASSSAGGVGISLTNSTVTSVPAISPGAPSAILHSGGKDQTGGLPGSSSDIQQLGMTKQHTDLGSSYKSGMAGTAAASHDSS